MKRTLSLALCLILSLALLAGCGAAPLPDGLTQESVTDAAAQTVASGSALALPTNVINSTGDITASGTTGVTLAAGQYLVTFASDASVADAGTLGAALALDGTALPYAVTAETQSAAGGNRITLTAIVSPTAAQTLTVLNNSGTSNTYANSTLAVVKLA